MNTPLLYRFSDPPVPTGSRIYLPYGPPGTLPPRQSAGYPADPRKEEATARQALPGLPVYPKKYPPLDPPHLCGISPYYYYYRSNYVIVLLTKLVCAREIRNPTSGCNLDPSLMKCNYDNKLLHLVSFINAV
eukprot:2790687-Pyramimonas_sp.AAC.1